jgi:predicted ATPase/class 3 adenylate cyclase
MMPPAMGGLTFLFSDIEGSTQLWERHPEAMGAALSRHDALLRNSIEGAGGRVVKSTGDGIHAVFASVQAAVAAALAGQRALQLEPWGDVGALRVRMALHTGIADARAGDYFGPAVNRTARLMALAHGGQVLLSAASAAGAAARLPPGATLLDLGQHRLKDLSQPEHVFQLSAPELPTDFPPLRSLALLPTNLPAQLTRLIGREAELAEAHALLNQAACRLLTLTGPGGIGKTRLALQLSAEALDQFAEGVWLIELAPVAEQGLVPGAIAATLGVREPAGRSLMEALVDYLRAKHLLLVMDNCEHVVDACARAAVSLLRHCPQLKLLTTSREPLGVPGEYVVRVPSLALPTEADSEPEQLEAVHQSESGQLFVERATAAQPHFALTAGNSAAVAQIVRQLDGIPLAIELAAARVPVLSAEQIAARLDDRFRLLTGGSRTALPRHQTLLAAIEWSYQLLAEQERGLLRRLSVFAGGWVLDAAEEVASDSLQGREEQPVARTEPGLVDRSDVLDLLSRLVAKSLVLVEETEQGEARYQLLETIRQFARDRLVEAGEANVFRARHLNYCVRLAETSEKLLFSPEQGYWLNRLQADHDNLRSALAYALDHQPAAALRLAAGLRWFWQRRGFAREGRDWTTRALDRSQSRPAIVAGAGNNSIDNWTRGRAQVALALLCTNIGDHARGRQAALEAVPIMEAAGDRRELALALAALGLALIGTGEVDAAREALRRGEALARTEDDPVSLALIVIGLAQTAIWIDRDFEAARTLMSEVAQLGRRTSDPAAVAIAAYGLGWVAYSEGDWNTARRQLDEAMHLFEEIGDRSFANVAHSGLADVARRQGEFARAEADYREVITTWQALGHRPGVVRCLECLAFVASAQHKLDRAGTLLGAAEALRESLSAAMAPDEWTEYDLEVTVLRQAAEGRWDELEAAWEMGRHLSYEEAVELALSATA